MPELKLIHHVITWARARYGLARGDERGQELLQVVILTAILGAVAIAVGAVIVAKVMGAAEKIPGLTPVVTTTTLPW